MALFLILWIGAVDLCWQRTNVAILYLAPLVLLAVNGDVRRLWRVAMLTIGLTYGLYFLKNYFNPVDTVPTYFDYRLVNRTLVSLTIVCLTGVLQHWIQSRDEDSDEESPEVYRYQTQEFSTTFALICCIPLVLLIVALDFRSPLSFNLAILYPVPLFICGWTRNRVLVWSMFGLLALLGIVGFVLPHGYIPDDPSLFRNRLLALGALNVVALSVDYWPRHDREFSA